MRTLFLPPAFQDSAESGRLILRDGSTALIRPSEPPDRDALRGFFGQLSSQSKRHRFFSSADPPMAVVDQQCDSSDPHKQFTLIVSRVIDGEPRIIACGSYVARDESSAEVAFTVDDEFQGKGLGGLLLERLALIGARHGFVRFWAVTQIDNRLMLDTFRRSGFPLRSKVEDDYVEIDLSVAPSADSANRSEVRDRVFTTASLRPFFEPRPGELAIINAPHDEVLRAVDDCAAAGARALIVTTPDDDGTLHDALREKVRALGMRVIGPSSMGLMNTDPNVQLNATLGAALPARGNVAMSSQNGALGLAMLALARQRHVGVSTFVCVGDKADISGNDLLQYWQGDAATRVILLYLESFGNPRRFARIARGVSREKPIVVVKPGRHAAVDALFRQTGVIRAETLDEMFDLAAALDRQPLPAGRRVAILSDDRGPGVLCAAACEAAGLRVVSETVGSSYDTLPDADAFIVIRTRAGEWRPIRVDGKPILVCLLASDDAGTPIDNFPTYAFPESAARALGKIAAYAEWRRGPHGIIPDFDDLDLTTARAICRAALAKEWLSPEETRGVLKAMNLRSFSPPRREKVPEGGMRGDSGMPAPLTRRYAPPSPRFAGRGTSLHISMHEDPLFGPLIEFSPSGVLAEPSVRVTPLTDRAAAAMVRESRGFSLIEHCDLNAVHDVLLRVSRLVEEVPEIAELDLDPIQVGDGCHIAAARIRVMLPRKEQAARYTTTVEGAVHDRHR
ncbi:MAG TPA: GNAT family N-acetyltransferase [Thermoanaerobaculia bacterium]|nr:GNAT family N-acetyltransferase [Thermoanaerobaculia bacterium]